MFDKPQKSYTDLLGKTNHGGRNDFGRQHHLAPTRLDGHLIGNFTSKGRLVIGPAGSITGDVNCKTADIKASSTAKSEVSDLLSVRSKASIKGEAVVGKLSVEPGADFHTVVGNP